MEDFKQGQYVEWESGAFSNKKTKKIGSVIGVIPAEQALQYWLSRNIPDFRKYFNARDLGNPGPREHDSYLVVVNEKPGTKAKAKLYYPRVGLLKPVGA